LRAAIPQAPALAGYRHGTGADRRPPPE